MLHSQRGLVVEIGTTIRTGFLRRLPFGGRTACNSLNRRFASHRNRRDSGRFPYFFPPLFWSACVLVSLGFCSFTSRVRKTRSLRTRWFCYSRTHRRVNE